MFSNVKEYGIAYRVHIIIVKRLNRYPIFLKK